MSGASGAIQSVSGAEGPLPTVPSFAMVQGVPGAMTVTGTEGNLPTDPSFAVPQDEQLTEHNILLHAIMARGISESVAKVMLAARRDSSERQYKVYYVKFFGVL